MNARFLIPALLVGLTLLTGAARADDERVNYIPDQNGCKVVNPTPRPEETVTWTGGCKDGLVDGTGVLQFLLSGIPDEKYEGEMKAGYAEGRGVQVMLDGGRYEGEFSRSRQHGQGTYYAPDGSIYEGAWHLGKPHGRGTYRTPEGRVTRGTWSNGRFEGEDAEKGDRT